MQDLFFQVKDLIFSKTAKETGVMFFGNISSFFFGIIFIILAARAIGPSGWGVVVAVMGFVVILSAFGDLGLTSGLFRFVSSYWGKGEKKKAEQMLGFIFGLRLISALVLALLLLLFSSWVSHTFFSSNDTRIALISALGLVGVLLIDFQITAFQSKSRWILASFFSALTNLFRLLFLAIALKYFAIKTVGLLFIFFISPVLSFAISLIWEKARIYFPKDRIRYFKRITNFSIWMGINRIAGSIASRVDALLLLSLAGAYNAGIVGIARQLSNTILILLGSFATVIAPRFASYEGEHRSNYFRKTYYLSALLGIGILMGILLVDPIVSLLGPKYIASSAVLKWLLVGLIPFALSAPAVNALIYSFRKPQIIAIMSAVQLPLVILGNIYFIPRIGIFGPVLVIGLWNLSSWLVASGFARYYFSFNKK